MTVPSLRQLALRTATKNIDDIEYVPEVPYECIRSLLRNVKTAGQLLKIESTSPHIIGRDAEIWKILIKRDADVPLQDIPEPKDPAKWWKVHRKLLRERDAKVEKAVAALKEAMNKHEADKESLSTETLPRTAASLPKRTSGWGRADTTKPAPRSNFLARAREQTREKAIMRKNTVLTRTKSGNPRPSAGKMAYAPNRLGDNLPEASHTTPLERSLMPPQKAQSTQAQSASISPTANNPRRMTHTSLIGKRKLAPASNVFGPTKRRY